MLNEEGTEQDLSIEERVARIRKIEDTVLTKNAEGCPKKAMKYADRGEKWYSFSQWADAK